MNLKKVTLLISAMLIFIATLCLISSCSFKDKEASNDTSNPFQNNIAFYEIPVLNDNNTMLKSTIKSENDINNAKEYSEECISKSYFTLDYLKNYIELLHPYEIRYATNIDGDDYYYSICNSDNGGRLYSFYRIDQRFEGSAYLDLNIFAKEYLNSNGYDGKTLNTSKIEDRLISSINQKDYLNP